MDVINNPAILDKLDDKTAIPVAQRALQELDELFIQDPGSNKGPKANQSDVRRRLERQRNVLLWQLKRRESRALTARGSSSSAASRPGHEPAKIWPAKAVSGRRQQSSGSARKIPGAQPPFPNTGPLSSCNICMENHPQGDTVTFACNHHCCRKCLNEIYKGATADETRYPPRCCQPIPIEQSRRLLESHVLGNSLDKQVEWKSKDRTYCSNRTCAGFIRPENIRGRDAKCHRCGTRTCADCKQAAHSARRPCAVEGHGTRLAFKVMEQNKWRRCKGCNTGIERAEGCNHMRCSCGREFCYDCGAEWGKCDCLWFPPNTGNPFRRRALNPPANRAYAEFHPRWTQNPGMRAHAGPDPLRPPGPSNRANVGFNHKWPPNPTAGALAGPEPLWPPYPANGANVPPNPIQPPNLEKHSLGGDFAWLQWSRRIRRLRLPHTKD